MTRPVRKLDLSYFMFFFELLSSYVSLTISFYVSLTHLFSTIPFPYLLTTRDIQDEGEPRFNSTNTGNSLNIILQLKNCQGHSTLSSQCV